VYHGERKEALVKTLKLVRFDSNEFGTFGRLGKWVTLEEEDLGNRPNVSCIPTGEYLCKRTRYLKGGYETFEVMGVPGRSRILFHTANTEEDIQGCIGLGMTLGVFKVVDEESRKEMWKIGVRSSKAAFAEFMKSLEGVNEWKLVIEKWGP
jgi:hypothetical protein